jgi:hypothetical protein
MRRSFGAVCATALVLFLLVPPSAPASEQGGNPCVANASAAGWTVIGLTNPPNADVFMVPTLWSGLITRWKVPVASDMAPLAQQLVIFEQVYIEGETRYRKVGESAVETVVPGSNEFATHIPLQGEGHHYLGLHGPLETLFCDKQELAVSGVVTGDFPLGEIRSIEDKGAIGAPVTAISEPDRDQDGYGDETQDGCERSAAIQGGCPTVTPSAVAKVEPGAIVVSVRTDSEGLVKVAGQTGWRLPPKAKKGAKASKRIGKRFVVPLRATEEKAVPPGSETVFRVPLPKSVKRRLGGMKASRSLNATITATATDLAYRETSTTVTVKLRGRKPARSKR